jgi:penicillin-binding protein 1A
MARQKRPKPSGSGRTRWIRRLLLAVVVVVGLAGLAAGAASVWALTILPRSLPAVTALERIEPSRGSKIYDDRDELITEFHVERRIFVPLTQVPKALRDAILATEDARFYSHYGVDPTGIARAIYQNFRHGRIVEGGSTITQQLAKVLFLTPDKSLDRKIKEAALALELERRYSKDRILEMYLNHIYFGHGAFGVEAAARTYFGKGVNELSLAECALLAGLPKAPTTYSPFERAEAAKRRRGTVLGRMVDVGALPGEEAKRAAAAKLELVPPERRRTTSQYYLEYVQQLLEQQFGADIVFKGGLQVYTTLSPSMQLKAEQSVREGLRALEARRSKAADRGTVPPAAVVDRPEGALLAIEPQTGYIKSMVGGYDFFKSEFNRAVQARRQPGSAFKPFVYIAALEAGFTPASQIEDAPVVYQVGAQGKAWKPDNYDRKFRGQITLQQALEESVNIAAVKLQERVGIRRTIDVARRLGVESPLHENLSLALGTSDLTLLELTSAYGALANQGAWTRPVAIRYVLDAQGKLLEENVPENRQVVAPEVAYVATHMMRGTIERGTGAAAKALGRPAAAKTGTTNDYSNAWFIGYTPQLVTGVWVGYDRPRSLGRDETGSRVAVPIWTTFMTSALADMPREDFAIPERVVLVPVDLDASGACVKPVAMAFVAGTEPRTACGPGRAFGPPPAAPAEATPATAAATPAAPAPPPPAPVQVAPGAPALPPPSPAPAAPPAPASPIALPPRPQATPATPTAPLVPAPTPAVRGTQSP